MGDTATLPIRSASVERKTSETHITCTLSLDTGPGMQEQVIDVHTGIGFLDHVSLFVTSAADTRTEHVCSYSPRS